MLTPEQSKAFERISETIAGAILSQGVLAWLLAARGLVPREAIAEHLTEFLQANDPKAESALYEPTRRLLQMIQIDRFSELH